MSESEEEGWIYFIQAGAAGPIKIGWAKDPERRLRVLQTGQHRKLRLLGIMPGTRRHEHAVHRRFATAVIQGEWYLRSEVLPDVMALILDHGHLAVRAGKSRNSPGQKPDRRYLFKQNS